MKHHLLEWFHRRRTACLVVFCICLVILSELGCYELAGYLAVIGFPGFLGLAYYATEHHYNHHLD
jgi:hypothetical protein